MAVEDEYSYLELLGRKLDAKQMAACCRTENTIVAAGAGSGKTQVLATRFAWLVMSEGIPVSQILTLTFTRKAAAEMYQRIYQTLSFFAGNEDTPALERGRAAQAVRDFSESHIQTLDSYRSGIVRQAANRYGIRPDFGSDDGKLDLSLLALQFVLQKLDGGSDGETKAIRHFAGTTGMQDFAESFIAAPVSTYASLATGDGYFSSMLPRQMAFATERLNELAAKLPDVLDDAGTRLKGKGIDAIAALEDISGTRLPAGGDNLTVVSSVLAACADLLPLVETADGKPRAKFEDLDAVLSGLYELACYMEEYPYICGLYRLLDEFTGQLNKQKRLSGMLSFKDIADMAMKVLIEQEDIRKQEKAAYSKIMIDEFQDNNGRDRDLLFLLSEKEDSFVRPVPGDADSLHRVLKGNIVSDKLFFVGDEKQSIYRFRGADVSVFNELKDDLGSEPLQMNNNYRSSSELLSFFNQLFGGFLPAGRDSTGSFVFNRESGNLFEASYPSVAQASKVDFQTHEELALPPLTEGNSRAHACMFNSALLDDDNLLAAQDQIAYFVAKKIKESYSSVPGSKYSDFAVLDRSRTNRTALIRWLNAFGIPYSLDQQGSLFQEAPVNDIYAMLRLCVYPSDKKAFATVLASPFVGLGDAACQLVLAGYTEGNLWHAFSPEMDELVKAGLTPEDYGRYKEAGERFASFREEALREKITRTLDRLWNGTGYRYNLMTGRIENLLSEHFDLLFEMARQSDEAGKSLAWFVDQLGAIRDKRPGFFKVDLDEDISNVEYPVEKADSVSVMTIHKSKGLQFRHVFVLGCCGSVAAERTGDFFSDDELGLSVKLKSSGSNPFFERKRDVLNQMAAEEFKRVFYVAVTRAEEDVYIVGDWKETKTEKDINDLPMMQRIICSYYDGAKSAGFPTGKDVFVSGAPFFFQSIAPVSKKEAFAGRGDGGDVNELVRKAGAVFAGEPSVAFGKPDSDRKTPHSLEIAGKPETAEGRNLYPQLSSLLKKHGEHDEFDDEDTLEMEDDSVLPGEFGPASFGSIAHSYLEAAACGIPLSVFKPDGRLGRLLKDLGKEDERVVCDACSSMVTRFFDSDLGRAFRVAKDAGRLARAEYEFRMFKDGIFYTGSIDLLFEEAGLDGRPLYTIVDYKTDSVVNRERYRPQLECYREAVAAMYGVDISQIRIYLYFLRFDQAVEL